MRRYINASVATSHKVNFSGRIGEIINELTLTNGMFVPNGFSFYEDFSFCPVPSDESKGAYRGQYENLRKFGAVIRGDSYVLPKGLTFDISFYDIYKSRFRSLGYPRYLLSRNGASIIESTIVDYSNLTVTFTDFGFKCYLASEDLEKPYIDVAKDALVFANYFLN